MSLKVISGGKITLIMGPMFSGKTTSLINTIKRYNWQNKKAVLVKYTMDNRYSSESKIITHDKLEAPALNCQKLTDILTTLKEYDVIGIDEGQFFLDVFRNNYLDS